MSWCANPSCPHPDDPVTDDSHSEAGFGYFVHFHPECCPRATNPDDDNTLCQETDHTPQPTHAQPTPTGHAYPPPTPTPTTAEPAPDTTGNGYIVHNGLAIHLNPNIPDGETLQIDPPDAAFRRYPHGRILIIGIHPRPWAHHAVAAITTHRLAETAAWAGTHTAPPTALHVLTAIGMDPDKARDLIATHATHRATYAMDGQPLGVEPIPTPPATPAPETRTPHGNGLTNVLISGTLKWAGTHGNIPTHCPNCRTLWATGTPPTITGTITCKVCHHTETRLPIHPR